VALRRTCRCTEFHRVKKRKSASPVRNVLKTILKIDIKIDIKTAPTCFGAAVTPSSGSALFVLAKVTVESTSEQFNVHIPT